MILRSRIYLAKWILTMQKDLRPSTAPKLLDTFPRSIRSFARKTELEQLRVSDIADTSHDPFNGMTRYPALWCGMTRAARLLTGLIPFPPTSPPKKVIDFAASNTQTSLILPSKQLSFQYHQERKPRNAMSRLSGKVKWFSNRKGCVSDTWLSL